MRSDIYQSILRQYWGYDDFRGIQREIIESIGSGHDTLGLMPTGGGKSITFQVPALAMEGVCIVVTPLIALMKDQVQGLRRRGIRSAAIHSGLQHQKIIQTLENAVFGGVKLLYVSPERLSTELFIAKVRHMHVSFICVDEAHCISQWGYDFRPSYLAIAKIREIVPDAPVLALTASATPSVVDDIQERLAFHEKRVFKMSFERRNLAYVVRYADSIESELLRILRLVPGAAIVYTRSRERTHTIADYLNRTGISATSFHAGLDDAVKDQRQRDWQADKVRVMVATNAFGMGIDKPDVRLVVHADCPDSIEAYFQEAGRAGRDGQKAYAVMLYTRRDDLRLAARVDAEFPPKDEIRTVYDHLAYFYEIAVGAGYQATFPFDVERFCKVYHHYPQRVLAALKILGRAGYIEYKEPEHPQARVRFLLERDELYRLRDNGAEEDAVIVALLRIYAGLFTDYQYIDKDRVAELSGLDRQQVHLALKELSRKRILSFIPERETPTIHYLQRREESKHLTFPPPVYDDLKQRLADRVQAMKDYAKSQHECRSRMLLHYFGEESDHDCGQCDVCKKRTESDDLAEATRHILDLLADHQPHDATELDQLAMPSHLIYDALDKLLQEEIVHDYDGKLVYRGGN